MSTSTIWGIHAGRTGDAHSTFLQNNLVALGWTQTGDLSAVQGRETYKSLVAKTYPDVKPGAIPNIAGQLYRFVHEIKAGDLVAYPSKSDRQIHIGTITGEYKYDAGSSYPHTRAVKWARSVPRLKFSQGALYEIGSAMSLFQIKNYADEFRAMEQGEKKAVSVDEDLSVISTTNEIIENTRDFILKKLAQELKGHPFADFVGHVLNTMGYRTRISPPGTDGGIDIIAHRDELGFEPPIIKVQVKSGENTQIGGPEVSGLYGNVDSKEYGLFVTLGSYSNPAKQFARGKANLRIIDGNDLIDLILSHYEKFDSHYKAVIPLKRVYVPQPDESVEE